MARGSSSPNQLYDRWRRRRLSLIPRLAGTVEDAAKRGSRNCCAIEHGSRYSDNDVRSVDCREIPPKENAKTEAAMLNAIL